MADFCMQCSERVLGEDFGDMRGLTTEADTNNGLYANVLCEGCGPSLVDHEGRCVNPYCLRHHGTPAVVK